uniref:MULE transposase domain-containing protein n=1 Tax=Plectus sambesii TaxID=2011161 RepID=A0A914V3P4_9BILA
MCDLEIVDNYTTKGKTAVVLEGYTYIKDEFGPAPRIESLEDIDMTLERTRIAIRGPAGDLEVNFLLHDSGASDPNRILIFGTTSSVASLSRSRKIHADGTFKVTPTPFKQLYVLHFEDNEKLYPGAFILLSGKTKSLYDHMLQVMQSLCDFQTTKVVTDFEFQSMQAFGDIMGVEVEGCFFHFAQAVMRAAKRFNTFTKIARSPLKKQHYVMLRALAFLPPGDIPAAFDAVVEMMRRYGHHADFAQLLKYMETTWVVPMCNPTRPALGKFPPAIWSMHTRTLLGEDLTNNKVEGWHLKINNFMDNCHLTFYVFLDELKKFFRVEEDRRREQQRLAIDRAACIADGKVFPPSHNIYNLRSAVLQILCQSYQNQLYVTNPPNVGTIWFLSEVAATLLQYQ